MEFRQFYITWYSRVCYFAREYVLCEEDAENIVQDVFVDLYQKRIVDDDQINQVSYLFASTKNRCIDYLRRKLLDMEAKESIQKEFCYSLQMKFDSLEAFETDWKSEEQINRKIKDALETLPDRCREIFIKSKIEGKKYREIAEEMHISIKTVETQISIAYRKLREELKEYLPLLMFLFLINS